MRCSPVHLIERSARYVGEMITRAPKSVMFFSILTAVLLSIGIVASSQFEVRSQQLYVQQRSQLARLRYDMADTFGLDPDPLIVLISRRDGGNIVKRETLLQVLDLHETILNSTTDETLIAGSSLDPDAAPRPAMFSDVCLRRFVHEIGEKVCIVSSLLELWLYDRERLASSSEQEVAADVTIAFREHRVELGGVTHEGGDDVLAEPVRARAVMLVYYLDQTLPWYDNGVSSAWEAATWHLIRRIHSAAPAPPLELPHEEGDTELKLDEGDHPLRVTLYSRHINEIEAQAFVSEDGYLMGLAVGCVLLYVTGVLALGAGSTGLQARCSARLSRTRLGLSCAVAVGLSLGSGFGLSSYLGIPLTPVSPLIIFTLLGVSVDDMIIIYDCFARQAELKDLFTPPPYAAAAALADAHLKSPKRLSVEARAAQREGEDGAPAEKAHERRARRAEAKKFMYAAVDASFADAMAEAAVAITLTSATTLVALCTGVLVDFPVYAYFCATTACCIVCVFFFQATFFSPLLLLHAHAEVRHAYHIALTEGAEQASSPDAATAAPAPAPVPAPANGGGDAGSPAQSGVPTIWLPPHWADDSAPKSAPPSAGSLDGLFPLPPGGATGDGAAVGGDGGGRTGGGGGGGSGGGSGGGGGGMRGGSTARVQPQPQQPATPRTPPATMRPAASSTELGSSAAPAARAMRVYAQWLLTPSVSYAVLGLFVLLIGGALWVLPNLEVGLPQKFTVPSNSDIGAFLNDLDSFWSGDKPVTVMFVFKCERMVLAHNASAAADADAGILHAGQASKALSELWKTGELLRIAHNWLDAFADWLGCSPDVKPLMARSAAAAAADGPACSMHNLTLFLNDAESHACERWSSVRPSGWLDTGPAWGTQGADVSADDFGELPALSTSGVDAPRPSTAEEGGRRRRRHRRRRHDDDADDVVDAAAASEDEAEASPAAEVGSSEERAPSPEPSPEPTPAPEAECKNDEEHFRKMSRGHECADAVERCEKGFGHNFVRRICPLTCGLCTQGAGAEPLPEIVGVAHGGLDYSGDVVLSGLEGACACSVVDEVLLGRDNHCRRPWWRRIIRGGRRAKPPRAEHAAREEAAEPTPPRRRRGAHRLGRRRRGDAGAAADGSSAARASAPAPAPGSAPLPAAVAVAAPAGDLPVAVPPTGIAAVTPAQGAVAPPLLPPLRVSTNGGAAASGPACSMGVVAAHRVIAVARMPQLHLEAYKQWEGFQHAISQSGARGYAYHPNYEFGLVDNVIFELAMVNLAGASLSILCVLLCFLSPAVALLSSCAVVTIDILLFGMMVLSSVQLNSITLISLLIALALAIDYSCHLSHAYEAAPGRTRRAKATHALETMGASILSAGSSTLIGTLFLGLSQSAVFRTFFVLVWGTILWGLVCGLAIMPIVLSLVGPLHAPAHGHGHRRARGGANGGSNSKTNGGGNALSRKNSLSDPEQAGAFITPPDSPSRTSRGSPATFAGSGGADPKRGSPEATSAGSSGGAADPLTVAPPLPPPLHFQNSFQ